MIYLGESSEALKLFRAMKKEHTVYYTNSTTVIKSGGETYLIGPKIPFKTMGFMKRVKNRAIKTGKPKVELKSKISYFRYSKILNGVYPDAVELDVNQAYWKLALEAGYIDEEIYWEGLNIDKAARLMALGGLATSKRVYEYSPGNDTYIYTETIENPVTRSYFFDVANSLDSIMKSVMEGTSKNIYFYWVDAFFLRDFLQEYIVKALEKRGLSCKTKLVDKIEAKKISPYTQQIDVHMKGGGIKPFFRKLKRKSPEKELMEFVKRVESLKEELLID